MKKSAPLRTASFSSALPSAFVTNNALSALLAASKGKLFAVGRKSYRAVYICY
jgi:hypothetical protein